MPSIEATRPPVNETATATNPFESAQRGDRLPESERRWDLYRSTSSEAMEIFADGGDERTEKWSARIAGCSTMLAFGWNEGEGRVKLTNARFCKVRWCPVCGWRKSLAWRARMFDALPRIESAEGRLAWLHLTLTVRNVNVADLRSTVKDMSKAFHRLQRRKAWPGLGYLRSLEVTHSDSAAGDCHPHYHVLIPVPRWYFDPRKQDSGYLPHAAWVQLWRESMLLDYNPSVRIQRVRPSFARSGTEQTMHSAICEVTKYTMKPTDLTEHPDWFLEVARQLHGIKQVSVGGILREHLREDEPESDEEMLGEDGEGVTDARRWFYAWQEFKREYHHRGAMRVRKAQNGA